MLAGAVSFIARSGGGDKRQRLPCMPGVVIRWRRHVVLQSLITHLVLLSAHYPILRIIQVYGKPVDYWCRVISYLWSVNEQKSRKRHVNITTV